MKQITCFLIITALAVSTIGCPTRRYIPDPIPPEPQASTNEDSSEG